MCKYPNICVDIHVYVSIIYGTCVCIVYIYLEKGSYRTYKELMDINNKSNNPTFK